ncbi:hypothetical protein EON65_54415, partial [archaeon]
MFPSLTPSVTPSVSPSMFPSLTPSVTPSISPSMFPSYSPTVFPSESLSLNPSRTPSFMPTNAPFDIRRIGVRNAFYNFLDDKYASSIGGCLSWTNFIFNDVYVSSIDSYPSSLVIMVLSDVQLSEPIIARCDDSASISNILSGIYRSGGSMSAYECNGMIWKVAMCNGVAPALCVDCEDPCVQIGSRFTNPFQISPCTASIGFLPFSGSVSVAFLDQYPPPKIVSMTATGNKTSAEVFVELDQSGIISCGIFDSARAAVVSQEQIIVQNNLQMVDDNYTSMSFSGLVPSTDYTIYCLTQSYTGYTSISNVNIIEGASATVTTTCCADIIVDILQSVLFVGEGKADVIRIYMLFPPSDPVSVTVSGFFISNDNATVTPGTQSLPSSAVQAFNRTFDFSGAYFGSRYISIPAEITLGPGTIVLMGAVLTMGYNVTFRQHGVETEGLSYSHIYVVDNTALPTAPVIAGAKYSADGNAIYITFNIDTNRGGMSFAEFACSNMFSFPGVQGSTCTFKSDSQLSIMLGPNPPLGESDIITMLPGAVKAKCASTSICSDLPSNVELVASVASDEVETPLVSISGPNIVNLRQSVVLDLSYTT